MNAKHIKFGLKLLVIICLANIGIFAQNSLIATRWNLTEINQRKIETKAYIEFNQNRVTGNGGCNRIFGEAQISGKNIKFGQIGATRMLCLNKGSMKIENDFTNALEKITRFEKSGNTLKFYVKSRLVLKFKAAAKSVSDNNSSIRLEDKKWILEAIENDSLPETETAPFINFDKAKANAGGSTGCNVFGGNYTANGETIKIFDIISTMRACIEDERMNVEREFNNNLRNVNRYEITGEKLNLYQDKTLLLTFRAENK